ncbi:MAG: RnfABCDGE type electron transport complex subunit D [Candidatus Saccharimonadales bacterium]
MLRFIDSLLDRTTMYRLLLYYLIFLLAAAFLLSEAGRLHYNAFAIVLSATYLTAVCWISNAVFAYAFDAPTNKESSLITALILALIITPVTTLAGALFLTAAGGLAVASKYMLAIGKKHIFNPAAVAVVLTAWGAGQTAGWWVGSAPMLPFVIAGGLLLARKVRHWQMILSFVAVTYVATIVYTLLSHGHVAGTLHQITFSSALFFLAFVMLTEPVTSPNSTGKQRWYAGLVGLLFPPQVHLGTLYGTPELALVVGNIFTYLAEPKAKLFPTLIRKTKLAAGMAEFAFKPDREFSYEPGQYMEWTLPHPHSDSRGDRRYLTLASSPTEPEIRVGVRFYSNGSTYKEAMLQMDGDTPIVAAQLSGDFTLPQDPAVKLAFIAGGIGVTPYRSMLKYLLDKDERRDVTMLYSAKQAEEVVYKDIFDEARQRLGARITYCLTGGGPGRDTGHYRHGYIDAQVIEREIPDYEERLFYISGSHDMVNGVRDALHELGVNRSRIKTDFFPGYQ